MLSTATSSTDSALECHELTVRYGATTAVDAISFTISPGEIFGLLGPNGAGKTSVIRALTTIVAPASGTARFGRTVRGRGHTIKNQIYEIQKGYACNNPPRDLQI